MKYLSDLLTLPPDAKRAAKAELSEAICSGKLSLVYDAEGRVVIVAVKKGSLILAPLELAWL